MSISHWWLGHNTPSTARVVARCSTTEAPTVTVNGKVFTGTTPELSARDGVARIDVSGLPQNQELSAVLSHAGENTPITLKTLPANGEFNLVWGSCYVPNGDPKALTYAQANLDFSQAWFLGDNNYADNPGTYIGGTITYSNPEDDEAASVDLANAHLHRRMMHDRLAMRRVVQSKGSYYLADDHEIASNWANDTAYLSAPSPLRDMAWMTTDLMRTNMYEAQIDGAHDSYSQGNPPGLSLPRYFSFAVNHVRFIVIDCLSFKEAPAANAAFLGATQLAWLQSQLQQPETFKIIMSSKTTVSGNGDGFFEYDGVSGDLTTINTFINTNNISGVMFLTGDLHHPHVHRGPNFPSICACPLDATTASKPNNPSSEIVYSSPTPTVVGYLEILSDRLVASIIKANGSRIWSGQLLAGANDISYPRTHAA